MSTRSSANMVTRPRREVLDLYKKNADLQDLAHGAAHLIHGTSEGRFTIRYAPGHLTRADIEQVKFAYADYGRDLKRYPIDRLKEGWNTMPDGEEIFYISTPSAGLWSTKQRLERATSVLKGFPAMENSLTGKAGPAR
jgi:hypothetical protein